MEGPVSPASADDYKPCLYLSDMPAEFLHNLSVGDEVRVVIRGRVKAAGQREENIYDDKGDRTGEKKTVSHLDVEYDKPSLKVTQLDKDVSDVVDEEDEY